MSTTLTFEGRVDAWAMPDERDHRALTVRIGGEDVIAAVCEALLDLDAPYDAAVTLDAAHPFVGELRVSAGYAAGCVTCYEPAELCVDHTDVIRLLSERDKQIVMLTVTLAERPKPPVRIVAVELAHHYRDPDGKSYKPLDVIEVPEHEAVRLSRGGVVTRACAERLGLPIAPESPVVVQ